MSVQFKFRDGVGEGRRQEALAALARAGFQARHLFPAQTRPQLAAIFTVSQAGHGDLKAVNAALRQYGRDIEYVEAAPSRTLK